MIIPFPNHVCKNCLDTGVTMQGGYCDCDKGDKAMAEYEYDSLFDEPPDSVA